MVYRFQFRFDAAYHVGSTWERNLIWDPFVLGCWQDPAGAGIGIGASLDVSLPARSVIVARYAFSDIGVRDNIVGSFLGNYQYDPGERFGDLPLVAAVALGRGRVVVFGDTSAFQNASLASHFTTHIEPLLRCLSSTSTLVTIHWLRTPLCATVFLLLLCVLMACRVADVGHLVSAFAVGLLAGCALFMSWSSDISSNDISYERVLLIDKAHYPDVGHYDADWNAIEPLKVMAEKSGLLPIETVDSRYSIENPPRAIAIVAPQRKVSANETGSLMKYMQSGGTVIIASSARDARATKPLLDCCKVYIENVNLGSVPPEARQVETEPRLVDAAPIEIGTSPEVRALYRFGKYILVASVPVGRG